jgi:hypothetical protein
LLVRHLYTYVKGKEGKGTRYIGNGRQAPDIDVGPVLAAESQVVQKVAESIDGLAANPSCLLGFDC